MRQRATVRRTEKKSETTNGTNIRNEKKNRVKFDHVQ